MFNTKQNVQFWSSSIFFILIPLAFSRSTEIWEGVVDHSIIVILYSELAYSTSLYFFICYIGLTWQKSKGWMVVGKKRKHESVSNISV